MPRNLALALATTAVVLPAGHANLYCPQASDMDGAGYSGGEVTIVDRGFTIKAGGYVHEMWNPKCGTRFS